MIGTVTNWGTTVCMVLCIDPDYQRKGLGRMLLRWGLDKADAEGKRAFLTSTPEGKPLYLSEGMKEMGEPNDLWGAMFWPMIYGGKSEE